MIINAINALWVANVDNPSLTDSGSPITGLTETESYLYFIMFLTFCILIHQFFIYDEYISHHIASYVSCLKMYFSNANRLQCIYYIFHTLRRISEILYESVGFEEIVYIL